MSLFLTNVVTHTPVWVWGLLAMLAALGLFQVRDHVVSRTRALVQPIALGALSFFGTASAFGWHATVQPVWLAGLALGFMLNLRLMLPRRVTALPDGRFAIGGSWTPLVLILAIFTLRYIGSASMVIVPQLADVPLFAAVASALYGLPSGLLAARAHRLLQAGRTATALQAAGA
jgi:hypothetical protein